MRESKRCQAWYHSSNDNEDSRSEGRGRELDVRVPVPVMENESPELLVEVRFPNEQYLSVRYSRDTCSFHPSANFLRIRSETNGAALDEVRPGHRSGRFRPEIRVETGICASFGDGYNERGGVWIPAMLKPEVCDCLAFGNVALNGAV